MLPLLQALHRTAAQRGDGLRPEFLRTAGEGTPGWTFPIQTQLSALAGDHCAPVAPRDASSGEEIAAGALGLALRNSSDRLSTSLHASYQPEFQHMRCPRLACGGCGGMVAARCVSQKLHGEQRQ
jgi:hypothetical protein